MNKKHFLIVLVMVAVASASLFGGFQAYRYNRSLMNKSVFSNNVEAKANLLELGDDIADWWNRKDWNRESKDCSGSYFIGATITVTINGVPTEIKAGFSYNIDDGTRWACRRMEDGEGELAHCTGTICI